MTTLAELSEDFTSLTDAAVDHLLRLTASWSERFSKVGSISVPPFENAA